MYKFLGMKEKRLKTKKLLLILFIFSGTQSLFHYTDTLKCSYHKIKINKTNENLD